MISAQLLSIVRCPDCRGKLSQEATGRRDVLQFVCTGCRRRYDSPRDYIDMRPRESFAEQTKYLDEALHADARHERVSPPLLGSRIRNDMLRAFLAPAPGELVVDLGCGSGRALVWNRALGATMVGIDIAPFFSQDAREQMDLLLGDLRKLPFADATFDKAWSLDVLEHLSPEALDGMLAEAARVLKPGGSLFVYTHVRKNARIAQGLRWINRLAQLLDRWDLVDLKQEHLRKSDHLNPLRNVAHLEQVVGNAGFRIGRIRFYTPIVGGFVENILMRLAERALARRAARNLPTAQGPTSKEPISKEPISKQPISKQPTSKQPTSKQPTSKQPTSKPPTSKGPGSEEPGPAEWNSHAAAIREARLAAKVRISRRGPTYVALRALSFVMKLDLLLFGRITSGPFFALLVKR